ncbi:MAG: efflux RND transporter periplasmic adaptor subunit, partial [Thermoguttaceae bacterium]
KHNYAEQEFERAQQLVKTISQAEYDARQNDYISAKMLLEVAKQELAKGRAGARAEEIVAVEAEIRALEVALEIAQNRLEDTTLRAPFDGIVTNRMIENFEMVTTQPMLKEVLGIHDISKLKVRVFLPENALAHNLMLRNDVSQMEAEIVFTAAPELIFRGNLYELDTMPSSTNGLYVANFLIDAPTEINVLPGMVAEVSLVSNDNQSERPQLLVPSSAVLGNAAGENFVWIVDETNSTATKKMIKKGGLTKDRQYIVLGGLEEGETVITGGNRFLSEGVKVLVSQNAE